MRDQNAHPLTAQTEASIGVLLIIGFTGNPRVIVDAVSNAELVTNITTLRSGTQFELRLELAQKATTRLLKDIVDDLLEFDVKIQGSQTIPVPTLVFSLTPAKQARSNFLRRRIGRSKAAQPKPKPPPKSEPAPEVAVQPAQSYVPTPPTPGTPVTTAPSQTVQRPSGPLTQAAKTTGGATLRLVSTEISQAFAILWHLVKSVTNFISNWLVRGAKRGTRPFAGWLPKLPGAITKTSVLMTMSVNSLFGAGGGDDDKENTGTKETDDEKPENSDS